jgi:hypothetical protein
VLGFNIEVFCGLDADQTGIKFPLADQKEIPVNGKSDGNGTLDRCLAVFGAITSGSNWRHLKRPQTEDARRSILPAYHGVTAKLQHFHSAGPRAFNPRTEKLICRSFFQKGHV